MKAVEFSKIIPENFIKIGYNSLYYMDACISEKLSFDKIIGNNFNDDFEIKTNIEKNLLQPIKLRNSGDEVPVFSVDTSNIDFGETTEGFLCAIRGCIVWRKNKNYRYVRHGPFIFHITEINKQFLYNALKQPFFNNNNKYKAPISARMSQNIRTFFERYLQKQLCELCNESLILWDGSLTGRKGNSQESIIHILLKKARIENNLVLAFSKKSALSAYGRRLSDLINNGDVPCLLDIDNAVRYRKYLNFYGKIYAVKFTPGFLTFRLDIDRKFSQSEGVHAVENLISSDLIIDSYPETLRLAHILSRFSAGEVIAMQRYVTKKCGLRIICRPNIRQILFGPYGGLGSHNL